MTAEYPNLQLLEYIFRQTVRERIELKEPYFPDIDAFVFPQVWPNTGGGFAEPGCCYGQAMTKEYTSVLFDMTNNFAMVSFGNKPAYAIHNPNQEFVDDFNKKNMKSKYNALHCYLNEEQK